MSPFPINYRKERVFDPQGKFIESISFYKLVLFVMKTHSAKGNAKLGHMVNRYKHGMGNGNCCSVFTSSGRYTLVLSRKIRAFHILIL